METKLKKSVNAVSLGLLSQSVSFASLIFFSQILQKIYSGSIDINKGVVVETALSFIGRPVGAAIFGLFADKFGAKALLAKLSLLMAISTLLFVLLPNPIFLNFDNPLIYLIIFRIIQGIFFGSDIIISNNYLVEIAPRTLRGLFASRVPILQEIGFCISALFLTLMLTNQDRAKVISFGWKWPLLVSLITLWVSYYLRKAIFAHRVSIQNKSILALFKVFFLSQKRELFQTFILSCLTGFTTYLFRFFLYNYSFVQKEGNIYLNLIVFVLASFSTIIGTYFGSITSDLVGRKPILLFSSISLALLSWPMLTLITHPGSLEILMVRMIVAQIIMGLFLGMFNGAFYPFLAETAQNKGRNFITGSSYNLAMCVAAFLMPYMSKDLGTSLSVGSISSIFLSIFCLFTALMIAKFMKETFDKKLK